MNTTNSVDKCSEINFIVKMQLNYVYIMNQSQN